MLCYGAGGGGGGGGLWDTLLIVTWSCSATVQGVGWGLGYITHSHLIMLCYGAGGGGGGGLWDTLLIVTISLTTIWPG